MEFLQGFVKQSWVSKISEANLRVAKENYVTPEFKGEQSVIKDFLRRVKDYG